MDGVSNRQGWEARPPQVACEVQDPPAKIKQEQNHVSTNQTLYLQHKANLLTQYLFRYRQLLL